MLRKILVKFFITNKITKCKTSCSLKFNVFEIADNKNIAKLFSKYELFLLYQANFSSNLKHWYNDSPCLELPTILNMFFTGFPILSYPIQPTTNTSIGYTKPYGKPSESNLLSSCLQIIIPYSSGTPPIK